MTFDIISTCTSTAAYVAVLSGLIWHSRHRLALLALTGCAKVRATCARAFQPTLTIDDCHSHCAAHDSSTPNAHPLFPCVSDIRMYDSCMQAYDHAIIRLGLLQCTIAVQGTTSNDSCALWEMLRQQWIEHGKRLGMWRRWLLGYHEQQFPSKIVVEFNSTLLSITSTPLYMKTQRDCSGQRSITISPETTHTVYPSTL